MHPSLWTNPSSEHFMSFEAVIATTQRLQTSVEALAALGAELRIRREGLPADSQVVRRLRDVIRALDPNMLDGITAEQEDAALVIVQSAIGQSVDLLTDPARVPGWCYDDPAILQGQGLASRRFVRAIDTLAAQRPDLQRALQQPGAFLDVGTGVGWLAIEAARAWPALRCVGIDVWEPALRLARANLAGTGMEERVELRMQSVEQLDDQDAFTLAWLPPFIPVDVVSLALENLHTALVPDGWLVVSLLGAAPDRLSQALAMLKLARHGTYSWTTAETEGHLRGLGFEQVETFSPNPTTVMVVGKKSGNIG
jgi:SAM-dependent methyltransferase